MLFPVGFSFGKPSPNSPPMPGNRGAELLLDKLPLFDPDPFELLLRLLLALISLPLLDFPPTTGADRSFVTVFFSLLPC